MRDSLLLSLFRPQSGCFIVTKLKWENNSVASCSVARIFPEVRIVFKTPFYWPPSFSNPDAIALQYFLYHQPNDYVVYLRSVGTNLNWGSQCEMQAERLRDVWGGILAWQFFLKFGYVLMPFVAFRSPLRSPFSWQFRSIFECDGHQNAIGFSVPEIELLVELSIAFDFC